MDLCFWQALGPEKVVAVHIDNGFMRKRESVEVEKSLKCLGLRLKGTYKNYLQNVLVSLGLRRQCCIS